eukprot:GHUV01026846.1.p1 GENE.GHUV01026846.1~~GHUV01026846.1.p1  ORF type:complete len:216 (+),score=72.16 GHUV01026846.1:222-869(+)
MGQALSTAQGNKHAAAPALPARSNRVSGGRDGMAILGEVLSAAIATGFLVWGLRLTLSYMDPYKEQRREAKRQSTLPKKRLGRNIELNEFEMLLASNVLNPHSIDVSLDDIGGLEHVKDEMRLKVLKPLSEPDTFCTTLWRPVKGVLFYGPPGTGQQQGLQQSPVDVVNSKGHSTWSSTNDSGDRAGHGSGGVSRAAVAAVSPVTCGTVCQAPYM